MVGQVGRIPQALRRALGTDHAWLAGLAAIELALHLASIGLYGYHRDELYLLACGRRLEWGSVDHAPLTPALSSLLASVSGASPAGQRIGSALSGALVVWLTGASARALGGERHAQLLAASAVMIAPVFIYQGGVLGTSAVDQLAWTAAGHLVIRLLSGEDARCRRRHWLLLGLVIGVGLLNKYTVLILVAALAVGFATQARALLRAPWPWLAGVVAIVVWSPNLLWQWQHGFPVSEWLAGHHAARLREVSAASFLLDQPRLLHPLTFGMAVVGLRRAFRRNATRCERTLGTAFLVAAGVLLLLRGKPYYLAPLYPVLLAIGSIAVAAEVARWRAGPRRALLAVSLGSGLLAFVGTLPVLPQRVALRLHLHEVNDELLQFADWQALVQQVAEAYRRSIDSSRGGILVDSYGMAAAIETYGPAYGLPRPTSGANSYHAWGPGPSDASDLLAIGYPADLLRTLCQEVTRVDSLVSPVGLGNRYDFPRTIHHCRGLRSPLAASWDRLRRFD